MRGARLSCCPWAAGAAGRRRARRLRLPRCRAAEGRPCDLSGSVEQRGTPCVLQYFFGPISQHELLFNSGEAETTGTGELANAWVPVSVRRTTAFHRPHHSAVPSPGARRGGRGDASPTLASLAGAAAPTRRPRGRGLRPWQSSGQRLFISRPTTPLCRPDALHGARNGCGDVRPALASLAGAVTPT